MGLFKFPNIARADAEIKAAASVLAPALEKAAIRTIQVDGKAVAATECTLAQQISALLTAQPVVEDQQTSNELIQSNALIAADSEKVTLELAKTKTALETLATAKNKLDGEFATTSAALQKTTAENGVLQTQLDAAKSEFARAAGEARGFNSELSRVCVEVGCLSLKNSEGHALTETATPAQRMEAAGRIPFAEKLSSFHGAVNATLTKLGLPLSQVPGGPVGQMPNKPAEARGRARAKAAITIQGMACK